MKFEQDVKAVDEAITRGHLDLVVDTYRPLFEQVKKRAVDHLNS